MRRHVLVKSVNGEDQDCVLNGGSAQCHWHISTGNRCKNTNALFQMNMPIYNSDRLPYSQTQLKTYIAQKHLHQRDLLGIKTFCWMHAHKITGLRVRPDGGMRSLVTTRVIAANEIFATFSNRTQLSEEQVDGLYGVDDSGPFLLPARGPTGKIRDSMCTRDIADYANDARTVITADRGAGQSPGGGCNHADGPRNLACWKLTPAERKRWNTGLVWDKKLSVFVLKANGNAPIPANSAILISYGKSYWSGYYCPVPGIPNKWTRMCNPYREAYKRASNRRGVAGRGGAARR
jgi:hypothetical protein